jgi:hypothetical protein
VSDKLQLLLPKADECVTETIKKKKNVPIDELTNQIRASSEEGYLYFRLLVGVLDPSCYY